MSTKETRSLIELAHLPSLPLKALKATWSRTSHGRDMFAIVDMATHWPVATPLYSKEPTFGRSEPPIDGGRTPSGRSMPGCASLDDGREADSCRAERGHPA